MPNERCAEQPIAQWIAPVLFWLAMIAAVLLRLPLLRFESGDFTTYTGHWYQAIASGGGTEALRAGVSNYTPLYLYGLITVHWLAPGLAPVVAIKLVELPFDFLGAAVVGAIVRRESGRHDLARLAILSVLFAPTVVLNGSFWGQVDMIWACGVLGCVYFLGSSRWLAACLCFSAGLAFKLQAIFLAPLLAIRFVRQRPPLWLVGVPLLVYLLAVVPAWWAGRPLSDLLTIYVAQADFYARLSSNAAGVFQLIPNSFYGSFRLAGLIWGLGVIVVLVMAELALDGRERRGRLLHLALLSVVVVPFCLPKMHDRYFFAADVLAIALAFVRPRYAPVAFVVQGVSLLSYSRFLFSVEPIALGVLVFVQAGVVLWLGREYAREALATS